LEVTIQPHQNGRGQRGKSAKFGAFQIGGTEGGKQHEKERMGPGRKEKKKKEKKIEGVIGGEGEA